MELPQPRPFGAEGRKSTHDFLSLYSSTQDPRSQVQAGSFLKTHDFLQPLEQQSTKSPTEEDSTLEVTTPEKPLTQAPPPHPPPSGEHVLPGGIGTYSISHISYLNPTTVLKPEGGIFSVARTSSTDHNNEENSNCSSYTGSGFTLWEESAAKKGKTGKENVVADRHVTRGPSAQKRQFNGQLKIDRMAEVGVKSGGGPWQTSDRPSPSSTNTTATTTINHRNATAAFSSLSSSQPQPYHRNQSFMDMLKSAKVNHEEDDDEEDGFVLKKEASPQLRGDLTVKVGSASGSGKSNDQKPNTPRSKHSATEQRRRSKINDRFHMLRELIPHSDQKRDKASFLLEVIEYIHYLQEKVHKHEGSFQGWNQEPPKLMPWANNHRPSEGYVDQARATNGGSGPGLMFPANFEEKNIVHSPSYPRNGQNAVEPEMSSIPSLKAIDHHSGLAKRTVLLPVPLQPNVFTSRECGGGAVAQTSARLASDMGNMTCQPQAHWPNRPTTTNDADLSTKLKEHEMNIESGTISISSAYSQGLLNTLTRALQSSGVDLSQASVSVQIDLGKRANGQQSASTSIVKGNDIHPSNPTVGYSRGASSGDDSDQALKKRKTC